MAITDSLLRTQQVAEALGVSASTVKRWVDSGSLDATRTVGKHRLVRLADALRFARSQNLPRAGLEALLDSKPLGITKLDDTSRAALLAALNSGKETEARTIVFEAYASIENAAQLGDDLIRPVLERIGHGWETGTLDVFQEHRASRILETVLTALVARQPAHSKLDGAPLALGATPEGDLYTISGLLCELSLRELGWEVVNLGPNLPLASLAKAARTYRPSLIWLSVTHLSDPDRFVHEYPQVYSAADAIHAAICLGGPALSPSLRSRLMAASFGERIGHLAEFARRLRPEISPSHLAPSSRIIQS